VLLSTNSSAGEMAKKLFVHGLRSHLRSETAAQCAVIFKLDSSSDFVLTWMQLQCQGMRKTNNWRPGGSLGLWALVW